MNRGGNPTAHNLGVSVRSLVEDSHTPLLDHGYVAAACALDGVAEGSWVCKICEDLEEPLCISAAARFKEH